ncbi:MAG: HNH endonuclease signature motif containing protein [Candidatus Dormibacteria bacterium]
MNGAAHLRCPLPATRRFPMRQLQSKTCSAEGCERGVRARGWCSRHYAQQRKNGLPLLGRTALEDRLWAKVEARPSGCWEWRGARGRGYGVIWVAGALAKAHRVVYELLVEPIPPGFELDHLCRRPACVNPSHLEPVTHVENMRRGLGHGHESHCPWGHPYDDMNTRRRRRPDGTIQRECRECIRARKKKYRARRRMA